MAWEIPTKVIVRLPDSSDDEWGQLISDTISENLYYLSKELEGRLRTLFSEDIVVDVEH